MNPAHLVAVAVTGIAVVGISACARDDRPPAPSTATSTTSVTSATTTTATTSATTTTSATATTSATSTATTGSAVTSAPIVGGMTTCTKEALAQPALQAAQALGPDNLYTVDTLTCSDGWAVTAGILSSTQNPEMGAPTSFVFEQEGQFWVVKDKAQVCGTNPTTTTPPADAVIPAELFLPGCAAG